MSVYLSNWLMFYPIAFSLFVVLRLSQAPTDSRRISSGVLIVRAMLVILFLFALISVGARYSPLSVMWAIIAGVFGTIFYLKQRQMNRSAIAMTLLSCRDVPQMHWAAKFFDDELGGWLGRRVRRFRQQIAHGMEGTAALESNGLVQTTYERLSARLMNKYGSGVGSDRELFGPLRVEFEFERMLGRLAILGWCLALGPIVAFFQIMILPTLLRMLAEFEMPVPWMLDLVASQSSLAILLSIGIPLVVFTVAGTAVLLWFFPNWAQRVPFRWFCGAYYRSLGFITFARVAQHTSDATAALRQTSQLLPVPYLAEKFEYAATRVEQGGTVTDAMVSAELMSTRRLRGFTSQLDTSGLAWASEQLATWDVERMLYRYSVLIQWTIVCATLLFGGFVAMVSIGMMQALTQMIQAIA